MRLARAALAVCLWVAPARAAEFTYIRAGEGGVWACGEPPPGWSQPAFDDRAWTAATPPDGGACEGARFQRWRFDVGPEVARLATCTLRIRYNHGFAAYLNGVEIARRRLDPTADPAALATELHGPEAERVFIPVRRG